MKVWLALLLSVSAVAALYALYHAVLWLRHKAFDLGWIASRKGEIFTIVLGNLTLGGTGKTPHTEYLLGLPELRHAAVLSRGYGRSSRGFRYVRPTDTAAESGDEPLQMARKFTDRTVAVCEDRLAGISRLHAEVPGLAAVILDDAFQHRRLRPGLSILLTDYARPFDHDHLVPFGRLRDLRSAARRADAIVVTRCPADLPAHEMEALRERLCHTGQDIYFTTIVAEAPRHVFTGEALPASVGAVIGAAGIARPGSFRQILENQYPLKNFKSWPDHHDFGPPDVRWLQRECGTFGPLQTAVVTTEKDAVRWRSVAGSHDLPLYELPIRVRFLRDEERFRTWIAEQAKRNTGAAGDPTSKQEQSDKAV